MHDIGTGFHAGERSVPPSSSVALKHAHALITANNVHFWVKWPIPSIKQHRSEKAAACVNMPQVIKRYADNKIHIVHTARRTHLCIKDGTIFLCICSVLIRLPLHIALV